MKNAEKSFPRTRLVLDLMPDYFIMYSNGRKIKTDVSMYSLRKDYLTIKYSSGQMNIRDQFIRIIGAALTPDTDTDHLTPVQAIKAAINLSDVTNVVSTVACIVRNSDFDHEAVSAARDYFNSTVKDIISSPVKDYPTVRDLLSKRDLKYISDVCEWFESVTSAAEPVAAEPVAAEPVEVEPTPSVAEPSAAEPVAAEPVEVEPTPSAAAKPTPEKTFIGQMIKGNHFTIFFDGENQRTRVMIPPEYKDIARQTLDAAGFYFSPRLDSWNKKLTFKAYRAALALAAQLEKVLAA